MPSSAIMINARVLEGKLNIPIRTIYIKNELFLIERMDADYPENLKFPHVEGYTT
jgi:hypothetical protein